MSEQIAQPENLRPIEDLRAEVDALGTDFSTRKLSHFNFRGHQVDSNELAEADLRMYEIISRHGEAGELDLAVFKQDHLLAINSGVWSRKLFWAYLNVLVGTKMGEKTLAESLPEEKLLAFQAEIEGLKLTESKAGKTNHLTEVVTQDLTEEDYWMWKCYKNQEPEKPITNTELAEYADKVRGNTSREGFYSFLASEMMKEALVKQVQEMRKQRGLK